MYAEHQHETTQKLAAACWHWPCLRLAWGRARPFQGGDALRRRVPEADVEKAGGGCVLRADPGVRVSARAHKMSKSRGNVVNPDDVVAAYGADSLRLYEMFMGPLRDTKARWFRVPE